MRKVATEETGKTGGGGGGKTDDYSGHYAIASIRPPNAQTPHARAKNI